MSLKIRFVPIILVCLNVLVVYSQPSKREHDPVPRRLYQVTAWDPISGRKRFGFIDKTGTMMVGFNQLPKNTIAVGNFHEGRAVIYLRHHSATEPNADMNYRVGYINMIGKVVIAARFRFGGNFSEGLAHVVSKQFEGFIDFWGRPVIKLVKRTGKDFHEGLAATVSLEGKREPGYIDRSGRLVIEGRYWFVDDFSEGLAGVVADGKYGFINKRGELVVPARFDVRKSRRHPEAPVSSGLFSEGLACVRLDGLYGYINKQGDFVIPPSFSHAVACVAALY